MHYLQVRFKNVDDQAWGTEGEPSYVDGLKVCLDDIKAHRHRQDHLLVE